MNYTLTMKGSVWKCGWTDGSGKRHLRQLKDCRTRTEAENKASKMISCDEQYLFKNIAKDMYVPGMEHLKRMERFGKKLAAETVYQKRYQIENFLMFFGDADIRTLRLSEIEMFYMKDNIHSGSYKNNCLDTIASIYEETIWKCDTAIPKPKFQRFARNSKKADVFSDNELKVLLARSSWKTNEYYLMFNLAACCGLRISEMRAVRPCQFLWKEKVLVIDGFCKTNGERTNYNKKGSEENRKLRIAPLSERIIKIFHDYIQGRNIQPDELIFKRNDGTPHRREVLEGAFKAVVKKLGFYSKYRKLTPHSLRYTYVTRMRAFVDTEKVKAIVGHNSIAMTEYYTRFSLDSAIKYLGDSFKAVNTLF